MKNLVLSLMLFLGMFQANAQMVGKIALTGNTTLSGTSRSMVIPVFVTLDGHKYELPKWIYGSAVLKYKMNQVVIFGKVKSYGCPDIVGARCLNGAITKVKTIKFSFPGQNITERETFTGMISRKSGMAVESPKRYSYLSIGTSNIAVPSFLDANFLFKQAPMATYKVIGKLAPVYCTDMSKACGPTPVKPLSSIEIKF